MKSHRSLLAALTAAALLVFALFHASARIGAENPPPAPADAAKPSAKAATNTAGQTLGPETPFNVKKATLRWLPQATPEGNAELRVEFLQKPSAPKAFVWGGRTINLKENEGAYTAILSVDPESGALDEKGEPAPARPRKTKIFSGRHLVGEIDADAAPWNKPGSTIDLLRPPSCPASADVMRSLMVIHPSVVGDPSRTYDPIHDSGNGLGVWSFGHVMTVLANQSRTNITPEQFTRRWLGRWEHEQVVNDFTVEKRPVIRSLLIDSWPRKQGTDDLDLAKSPFRLLAIVNRVDLRDNYLFGVPPAAIFASAGLSFGGPGSIRPPEVTRDSPGGEARLIFGAVNLKTKQPVAFAVIFEFGVFLKGCTNIKPWAHQWYALKQFPLGSPAYNNALANITRQFVQPARDPALPPELFGLNQVRTNEVALAAPWELREFRVPHEGSEKGHLRQVTVGQTPNNALPTGSAEDLNGTTAVQNYVNGNVATLLTNTHVVPLQFPPGQAFLGARSLTLTAGFFWQAPGIINNDARHHFSLNTCNGCHGGETHTPAFVMVSPTDTDNDPMDPRKQGARLAPFLLGTGNFPDPAVAATPRHFEDLDRRKQDLEGLVCLPCIFELFHRPVRMTH